MNTTPKIIVRETNITETGLYFSASSGSTSALVCIHEHGVRVICKNASHQVWRGAGRFFPNVADALNGYKSANMRAIITAANNANH